MSEEGKSPTIFYGWFVVAACFAVTLVLGGTMWTFGVFFKPLENEFGWSRALVSSGYTAFLIGHAISLVAAGRLADRYSPRPTLLVSALSAALGLCLCSQIDSVSQLRIFLLVAGLGTGANWSVPTAIIQRWFYRRRKAGLALAIVVSGIGIGALIFAPLINHLILGYGWRNTYLIVGFLLFVIMVVSSVVIRQSPMEARTVLERVVVSVPKSVNTQAWTTGRAMTTLSFIGITSIMCIANLSFNVVSVHLVPHATDVGISATSSAAALGLLGGFSVLGRIMAGLMSERIGWQKIVALSFFGMALSLLWLIFLEATWMLYCLVFFYGICHGSKSPAQLGILSEFFGMRSLGELIGITAAISFFVGAFAPYIAGFVFDTTGSYFVAFIILMVVVLSGGLIASVMKKPSITPK